MNIQSRNWLLHRRHFLRGVGAAIALPMLDCMAAAPKPKRSAFIYLPNGVNTLDYQILQTGRGYQFSK